MPPSGGFPKLPRTAACAAFSALLLLPVLLPRHVPAADLPSHLYNTWLALLVREGRAPGVEIVPQWSNVLFDWWLEGLWRLGGPALAEKGAVAAAVLVFFWGAFALASAIQQRPAWASAPVLAMLTYGWTYHQGFFSYYLSSGFGFWVLAWVWNKPARWMPAGVAILLSGLAHPLGAAVAAGLAGFVLHTRGVPWPKRLFWAFLSCGCLAAAGLLLQRSLPCQWEPSQYLHIVFATQLRPFGDKFNLFVLGVPLLWCLLLALRILRDRAALVREPALPVLVILSAAIVMVPQAIQLPGTARPLHFVDFRLAMFLLVFVQAFVASGFPGRQVPVVVLCLMAVPYFGFLASDYRHLLDAQDEFIRAARQIPNGSRAVAAATGKPVSMNPLNHMLSKACIGRCFSYGAYAPSSKAFRLRAKPGSPTVLDDSLDVDRLQAGRFVVRPRDVPLFGIFLVSEEPFRLEARPLRAGETIPRQAVRIPPDWF